VATTATEPGTPSEVRGAPAAFARTVAAVTPQRTTFSPSATTLTAMWQRRDTRSLERAFDMVRRQTLAFHRCGMRVTDDNSAIARCEGVATAVAADGTRATRAAIWNISFRRTNERWVIVNVTMH